MGEPKHLLKTTSGRTLLQRAFDLLYHTFKPKEPIYISVAQESDVGSFMEDNGSFATLLLDKAPNNTARSSCPATGLLAAYDSDPTSSWLVLACDYPILPTDALELVSQQYEPPVTCFRNADGYIEPLIGKWSPTALHHLQQNVEREKYSLARVVEQLGGKTISLPSDSEHWLLNVNKPD
ncbi:hypothetical protein Golomagni_08077, partial [Golovinomyces magnicellulatus]